MASITEVMGTDVMHRGDYVRASNGDRASITGLENLYQALFHRLITSPGSLVHRPTYGVGIKDYLNGPNSLAKQRELANRIDEQFRRDPRVAEVSGVLVSPDNKIPSMTYIVVRVKPVGYDELEMKFVPFGA